MTINNEDKNLLDEEIASKSSKKESKFNWRNLSFLSSFIPCKKSLKDELSIIIFLTAHNSRIMILSIPYILLGIILLSSYLSIVVADIEKYMPYLYKHIVSVKPKFPTHMGSMTAA